MKMINSFRSKLLAITLSLMASVSTFAHDFFVDGIYYNILDDNNVEVTYKGSSIYEVEYRNDVVIPDNVLYNGVNYVVASIGKYAFSYSNVKSVIIGNNLTTIGEYAFYECYKLASVILGNNVTNIEGMAFMYCKALKSITLPNITHIGSSAFNNCLSLDSVTLGNGLRNIADNLFYQCSSLTHITIPDSIERIGEHAFYNCKLLKTIYIPNTVNMIGKYAFSGCSSLESIHIPEGVLEIRVRTFENCSSLKSILLPQSITSIGNNAFAGCAKLPAIDIPEGVKSIEGSTFENCTSLAAITIPNTVMTIKLGAFSNTAYYNDAKNWEEGVLYISNCLIEAKTSIAGDYSIKPGTRLIADYALFGCSNLTSVTFAQSVKSIGDASFYECKNMKVVNMSDSLQNIGDRAFAYCELLNPVTIPVGVKTFGTEVFMGCKSLVSIIWNAKECQDFPDFYEAPFYRISSKITSITFGDEVEYIPAGMCYGLSALPSVTIPVNVKRIGKDAFESCTSMTSITWNAKHYCDTLDYPPFEGLEYVVKSFTFGEGIETIPPYICKEMREITSITIPEGVKSIGRHAFNYCLGIPSVTIPKGVTTIGSAAFFHTYIESIIVPEGVTEIGGWAFSECYSLNKIELPSTLKSIGNSAFKETYYIDTLICKAVVPPAMGELPVFEGLKKERTSLFVPEKSIELYQEADQWKEFSQILPINNGPRKDNAKNGKIGGRPTPTQWNMLEVETKEMDGTPTILRAETFSYTLENDSIVTKGKTFYQLARQSTKDTAITKSFVGALHFGEDEDNRVYFLRDGVEYVLYDFTAEPGDTIEIFAGINNYPQETTYTHVVTGKDTLENGACRMMLEVVFPEETASVENAQKVWLAGLGSIDGIVHNAAQRTSDAHAAPAKSASSETQSSVMLCAWRDDNCLYTTNHPEYDTFGCVYNQDPTAVEDVQTSGDKYQKIIRDGHLYILRDNKLYDVLGTPMN